MIKLLNGDCLTVMKTMADASVDVAFTSPPYNRIRNDKYANYDDTKEDYLSFIVSFTEELLRICRRQVIVNIQMSHFNKVEVCKYIGYFAEKMKGMVIWEKTNPQPSTNPKDNEFSITNAWEFFFVLGEDSEVFRANTKIKNIISTSVNSLHIEGHGAIMKQDVADWFIYNFTRGGEMVLDCFMGTGTTGISCVKYHRDFIGIELDKNYYQISKERIEHESEQLTLF